MWLNAINAKVSEEEVVMDSSKELWNSWTNYWWYSCVHHTILPIGETGHERVGNKGKAISGVEYDPKEIRKEIGWTKGGGENASCRNMSARHT